MHLLPGTATPRSTRYSQATPQRRAPLPARALLCALVLVAAGLLPTAAATQGGPVTYPRVATYIDGTSSLSEATLDTLSWYDAITCRGNPETIAALRARNPNQRIFYRTLPQNICGWGAPDDSSWYPDTTFNLNLLCKFYALQNDWYLYDIYGEKIEEWGGHAANWTRYCPEGSYGTSVGMTYAEWYIEVALPQIAYRSPEWERWGWGSEAFDGLAWEILVDCPQFWNPEQFAIADPDRDGEPEGIEDFCWQGGNEDSLSILYRETNEYIFERLWEVLDNDLVINITSMGITVNPWWQWELQGLKLEGWKPDDPAPIQSWWSWMYGHYGGGELKRGGYAFAEQSMHPHGVDEREGWDASWIFLKVFGGFPESDYWRRMMRWAMGTTMLGDGYLIVQPGEGDYELWWPDYFDWDFGEPIDEFSKELNGSDTLYVRNFTKGLVRVNPYEHPVSGVPSQDSRFLFWLTLDDIEVESVGADSLVLTWIVPGCDQNTIDQTRIRYATFPITPENWDQCTEVPGPGGWGAEGERVHYTVRELEPETHHYLAGKNQVQGFMEPLISNVVEATTLPGGGEEDPASPAAIDDLASPAQGESWLRLSWSATGDDSLSGRADHYILGYRIGEAIADEADWETAEKVTDGLPVPGDPGSAEVYYLRDLAAETSYGVAIRVVDDVGKVSGLSNPLQATTQAPGDEVPPGMIEDLTHELTVADGFDFSWTAPGDDGDAGTAESYLLGYRVGATIETEADWSQATHTAEGLPVPLPAGTAQSGELRGLLPGTVYGLTLRAYDEAGNLSPLGNSWIAQTPGESPDLTPPGTITDLSLEEAHTDRLQLRWTAPGDDGQEGQADHFLLAYLAGSDPIVEEADWESANLVRDGLPEPPPAGDPVTWTLTDLAPGSDYSLAVRAVDDADHIGGISNTLVAATLPETPPGGEEDTVPPGRVGDLFALWNDAGHVELTWTAAGDDSSDGTAAELMIGRLRGRRLQSLPDWDEAEVEIHPNQTPGGMPDTMRIADLTPGESWGFALRYRDASGLEGPLSNSVLVTIPVEGAEPDTVPPAPVDDLRVTELGDDWLMLIWTASGDDSSRGEVAGYRVAALLDAAISEENWDTAEIQRQIPGDGTSPGCLQAWALDGLTSGRDYGIALRAVDEAGNLSAISNPVWVSALCARPVYAPETVTDLHAARVGLDWAELCWTAPCAFEPPGPVAEYALAWASEPPTPENWAELQRWVMTPEVAPGAEEMLRCAPLPSGETCWFALRSRDLLGNWSELSNPVPVTTHLIDAESPSPPTGLEPDLSLDGLQVSLRWAPAEDDDVIGYHVYGRAAGAVSAVRLSGELIATTSWSFAAPDPAEQYFVALTAEDASGNESALGVEVPIFPQTADLIGPFPHPIRDTADFLLCLPPGDAGPVRVVGRIFSIVGQPVRHWLDGEYPSGMENLLHWDTCNDAGARVAPGLYFVRLEVGDQALQKKIYIQR